jgi:hypothetical protein
MTNIAKFHYLTSSVIGDAAATLDKFDVSSDNYDDAWEMLLKEYDDKRMLICTNLQSFVCFPQGKFDTAVELKKLRDTVIVALTNLSKLGCQVGSWNPIVVFVMTEKLGSQTLAKWNDYLGDIREYLSHKVLDAFLRSHIRSLSTSTSIAGTVVDKPRYRSRSFVNHVSTQGCVNCAGSHGLAKCEVFLSLAVEQRSTLAREKRICFNCFGSGYFTPKCPSKLRSICCLGRIHSHRYFCPNLRAWARRTHPWF